MPFQHQFHGLLFTDLDGTIKPGPGRNYCRDDLEALKELGRQGWYRVVATGRSLFSFVRAWVPDLELDALIFSSGAGLCLWNQAGPGRLLCGRCFTKTQTATAIEAALSLGLGFYAYHAPPDSHHFFYHRTERVPKGFQLRLNSFPQQTSPWPGFDQDAAAREAISQLLIMVPLEEADRIENDFNRLSPGLSVLRSSSPFGDGCLWLEIFPPGVSKGKAASALAERMGLGSKSSVALGNDFNDRDLLSWAGRSFVTEDAPAELTGRYPTILPAGSGGLAQAAALFAGEAAFTSPRVKPSEGQNFVSASPRPGRGERS